MVPNYLSALFPRFVRENTNYDLRNQNDFEVLPVRTSLYERSFVPSAIHLWNTLQHSLRTMTSLGEFKHYILQNMFSCSTVPAYFFHGTRKLSVIHSRLRNNCSNLKNDLYNNHLIDSNLCTLCKVPENASHYFFECTLYTNERIQLFTELRCFHPLNCELLLFGNLNLTHEENISIVSAVHKYILNTKRF